MARYTLYFATTLPHIGDSLELDEPEARAILAGDPSGFFTRGEWQIRRSLVVAVHPALPAPTPWVGTSG
jgi:hypothetical protein